MITLVLNIDNGAQGGGGGGLQLGVCGMGAGIS